ncbi:MAG: glycosyl hydrolase family 18 protein [Clostridium sp.]|nr:glycosyl hydrolase family 18 protein [Clostridium sp.]
MKKKIIPVLVAIALIFVVVLVAVVPKILERYSYSKERVDLTEYFECEGDEARIMLHDELLSERALVRDGAVYFSYDTVAEYMEDRFYYNDTERVMKYTLPDHVETVFLDTDVVIKTTPDLSGQTAMENETLAHTAVFEEEGTLYLLADYVQRYCGMRYTLYSGEEPYRVQVFTEEDTVTTAAVQKATAVRRLGGIKSPILTDVAKGDEVVVLNRMETWAEVKTKDCVTGYIEVKYLGEEHETQRTSERDYAEPVYPRITRDHKIVMAWHQVMSADANGTLNEATANAAGTLNVISPTWFYVGGGADGVSVDNLATADYVARAHEKGFEVWALADDFTRSPDISGILSNSTVREALEIQLVSAALNAGVDGINIDFERISKECGVHFIQFLRELSILTHKYGLVLSVDNYVPEGGRGQYHLEDQGIVVDYVVIMGYDEHWSGCSEAGSVASIGFVERGISDTINMGVPADKIINGVPFFTRVWATDGGEVTSSAGGMQWAKDWVNNYGVGLIWDEITCQYYGELTSGGALYQIWMENAESIQVKLNVMNTYGVAGVSAWKLGYETADIWTVIAAYGNS